MTHFTSHLNKWRVVCCSLAIVMLSGCCPLAPHQSPVNDSAANMPRVHVTPIGNVNPTLQPMVKQVPADNAAVKVNVVNPAPSIPLHQHSVKPPAAALVKLGEKSNEASKLNECLSLLGYLPLSFSAAHLPSSKAAMTRLATTSSTVALPGSYKFVHATTGRQLGSLWHPHADNVITKGAVMRFELDHHLVVDGIAGPHVWHAIDTALKQNQIVRRPYVFVTVSETTPERLEVWKAGKVVVSTLANTGIPQSPTATGTWPIYLRYRSQEMKGTTPSGKTYDDPGVPYVSYFHGGDAVHGFRRSSYGYPQSLGCVEIPVPVSKTVFALVNYGTLVSVRK